MAAACALAGGCSLVNKVDACKTEPSEVRVNQRVDQSEFTTNPKAATELLGTNRILVSYVAQPIPTTSSEVRIALLDASSGERTVVCQSDFELALSDPNVLSYAATVAPVDLTVNGMNAKAAVAWIEGETDTRVKLLFVDERGCPLGKPFAPLIESGIATSGVSLAWSPTRKQLLVAYHDYHRVLATWLDSTSVPEPVEIGSVFFINEVITSAIGEDGRGAIGFASYASQADQMAGSVTLSVALLGSDGAVRHGPNGAAAPFEVAFPAHANTGGTVDFVVATGKNRYALGASLAESSLARQVVYAAELDAESGSVVTPPFRVEPDTGAAHYYPSLGYAPDQSLVVAWMSAQHAGTVARLFDPGGAPRFNAVSCNEKPFAVGARATTGMQGQPTVLLAANRVWVFHPGQPKYDSFGMGVVGWDMGWSELWPAK